VSAQLRRLGAGLIAAVQRTVRRRRAVGPARLLGAGLDAIVQRKGLPPLSLPELIAVFEQHRRHVPSVTPQQRLARYERAKTARPDRQAELRRLVGEGYQAAWRRGRWPRLSAMASALARIERSRRPC
jgi:hypothetical protein